MKPRDVSIAIALALAPAVGCAGVLGITDVRAEETEAEAGTPIPEAGIFVRDAFAGTEGPADASTPVDDGPVVTTGRRVFISTATTTGAIGSAESADALCNTAATGAKLGGKWVAWLSTQESNVLDRLTSDGPWSRLDGQPVAANRAQLRSAALTNPISVTEENKPIGSGNVAWTGTKSTGASSFTNCGNWKDGTNVNYGEAGSSQDVGAAWTESNTIGGQFYPTCNTAAHLYCFEQ